MKTKQVDYQNKRSFYTSETPLEEIKTIFIKDASKAYEAAYKEVMIQYATLEAADRQALYKQVFVQQMKKQWNDRKAGNPSMAEVEVLKNHFGLATASADCIQSAGLWDFNEVSGYAQLKDVSIAYTNAQGYTTLITTDFYIEAPELDWSINTASVWATGADNSRKTVRTEDFVVFKNWKKD